MARRRKQRVKLRGKVRRQRLQTLGIFAKGILKAGLLAAVVGAAGVGLHRVLFVSDHFMLKSVEIEPRDGELTPKIRGRLESFLGRPMLKVPAGKLERALQKQYPLIRSIQVRRSLPDGLKVRYSLRRPVAFLDAQSKDGGPSGPALVDEDGAVFRRPVSEDEKARLPFVAAASTGSLSGALSFLRQWSSQADAPALSTASVRRIAVDAWGEAVLQVEPSSGSAVSVVWGDPDPKIFQEKFLRLQQVWADLKRKSIRVKYVNLRDVPQRETLTEGRELVGRVIVRPATEKPASKTQPKI